MCFTVAIRSNEQKGERFYVWERLDKNGKYERLPNEVFARDITDLLRQAQPPAPGIKMPDGGIKWLFSGLDYIVCDYRERVVARFVRAGVNSRFENRL